MTSASAQSPVFLVGVDLEALPLSDGGQARSWQELELLTAVVLRFLRARGWRATFFTVGEVARRLPHVLAAIAAEGHEIGCHTDNHQRIDRLGRAGFRQDVERNLTALADAGVRGVTGFRAPFFSLTESSAAWAYETLRDCGITYSSSVGYSRNLSGWNQRAPLVAQRAGVIELPVSLLFEGPLGAPLGGLYFRCCPESLLLGRLRRMAVEGTYLSSFFHPHDFHTAEASYVSHGTFAKSPLMAAALAYGRKSVEDKLDRVSELGFSFSSFGAYLQDRGHRRSHVRLVATAK